MDHIRYYAIFIFFMIQLASSSVVINNFSISFPDIPAKSALPLGNLGMCGSLHVANPLDACSALLNPRQPNGTSEVDRIALIVRGECVFDEKIRQAQASGFRAAIIYDNKVENHLIHMKLNAEDVRIHAVFVSKTAGELLKSYAKGNPEECCLYPNHVYKPWTVLAISLISLSAVLVLLVVALVSPRNWRNNWPGRAICYARNVDAKVVEALPSFVFRHSCDMNTKDRVETCAICLEDYKDGEIVRLLPCNHAFHSSCVDSWLTKWSAFCPICKLGLRNDATNTKA